MSEPQTKRWGVRECNEEPQSGAASRSERTCPIKPAGPLQPSLDAAIAMVGQADVGPKHRTLAATSRRPSSVPDRDKWLDDVLQPTPTFGATRTEFVLPSDLI